MVENCLETSGSDIPQSDMLVTVMSRTEAVLGIVQMDDLQILETDNVVEL